jgi:hypothetical protein
VIQKSPGEAGWLRLGTRIAKVSIRNLYDIKFNH